MDNLSNEKATQVSAQKWLRFNGKAYYCALCPIKKFKQNNKIKVISHITHGHVNHQVTVDGIACMPCFLGCTQSSAPLRPHYHCPNCKAKIVKKTAFQSHILNSAHCKSTLCENQLNCSECGIKIHKRNLQRHIALKHCTLTPIPCEKNVININRHHRGQCVDFVHGIYLVSRTLSGPDHPIHVQKKTGGSNQAVKCTLDECWALGDAARRSKNPSHECNHLLSVAYCNPFTRGVVLNPDTLNEVVQKKELFSESRMEECINLQNQARSQNCPVVVPWFAGPAQSQRTVWFSVFTNKTEYWCRLQRTVVSFDQHNSKWSCHCGLKSCLHKAVAQWCLVQEKPEVLQLSAKASTKKGSCNTSTASITPDKCLDFALLKYISYISVQKKIPVHIPKDVLAKDMSSVKELIPHENTCPFCLSDQLEVNLVTKNAKVVTLFKIYEGITTYSKQCCNCKMEIRYQEWVDGLVNFDNNFLLSLQTCKWLRCSVQHHNAIGRIQKTLEQYSEQTVSRNQFFNAYLYFEALTDHTYDFNCVQCGHHPPIVSMDGNRKTVFSLCAEELYVPSTCTGQVDLESFWDDVEREILARGFLKPGQNNPFTIKPEYKFWAPWIGTKTRKSDICINTEYQKCHVAENDEELNITVDELDDLLRKTSMKKLKAFAKKCNVPKAVMTSGSKADIITHIKTRAKTLQFEKIFTKVWGASGGWLTTSCPHKVVYQLKCILRAEGPRDYIDSLLNFKYQPTILLSDIPHVVAAHGNKRADKLFYPNDGRLFPATKENIEAAEKGELPALSFSWIKATDTSITTDYDTAIGDHTYTKTPHPVSKQAATFSLYDTFHEKNTKRQPEILRRVAFIKEMRGFINTQSVEQIHNSYARNRYFLDTMKATNHVFLMRCLVHFTNVEINEKITTKLQKQFSNPIVLDELGRLSVDNLRTTVVADSFNDKPEAVTKQVFDVEMSKTSAMPSTKQEEFECQKCGTAVITMTALCSHLRKEHQWGPIDAPPACPICDIPIETTALLESHLRMTHYLGREEQSEMRTTAAGNSFTRKSESSPFYHKTDIPLNKTLHGVFISTDKDPESEMAHHTEVYTTPQYKGRPIMVTKKINTSVNGLPNLGNTCWFNAVCQAVAKLHLLTQANYIDLDRNCDAYDDTWYIIRAISCGNKLTLSEIRSTIDEVLNHTKMLKGMQQDAHEFLMSVIIPILRKDKRVLLRENILSICQMCNSETISQENSLQLLLDINDTIQDNLHKHFQTKYVDGVHCECQNFTVQKSLQHFLRDVPLVLILLLKRWNNNLQKIQKHLAIPYELKLPKVDGTPTAYHLKSVVVQLGEEMSTGHYVTYEFQTNRTVNCYDDSNITNNLPCDKYMDIISQNAYILFYEPDLPIQNEYEIQDRELVNQVTDLKPSLLNLMMHEPSDHDDLSKELEENISHCMFLKYGPNHNKKKTNLGLLLKYQDKMIHAEKEAIVHKTIMTLIATKVLVPLEERTLFTPEYQLKLHIPESAKQLRQIIENSPHHSAHRMTEIYIKDVLLRETIVKLLMNKWNWPYSRALECFLNTP